ncbi:MAG: hypothetical protein CME26_09615 [Gemmatimonadetes bacterium]|nr:hypothetical protein [Gemmatimonadota bacterium]|tara:strand:- start:1006 stop:1422 length:417 start_codon:yes stop_codon:yes gene_type:complete
MCTSFLDSLNGSAAHISQHINLGVVAKAPIDRVQAFADKRGWSQLQMLSSSSCDYNSDYFAEEPEDGIFHFYATELYYVPFSKRATQDTSIWCGPCGRCSTQHPTAAGRTGSPPWTMMGRRWLRARPLQLARIDLETV